MSAVKQVIVGMGTCGLSAGASDTYAELQKLCGEKGIELKITGCIGMCYREPLVEVRSGANRAIFGEVNPTKAREIFEKYVLKDEPLPEDLVWGTDGEKTFGQEAPVLDRQVRIVLRNCGLIDPESLDEYCARGGYVALKRVLTEMKPSEIIDEVKASGLRGRGGAGFPTGLKWSFAAAQPATPKYVICNADEGDPGAFMDRSVLEGDPHAVLEGMAICGRAIGANAGYIYCRAEYPLAIARLEIALKAARQAHMLGKNIMGSGFDFDITIKQGAGAFVCGEETALFASIEGQRGMPRIRPPFPAEKGLWQHPSNNNNVETFANVAWIIRNGAAKFAEYGTEKSKGTKVFALAGKVARGGLCEVPMGTTIKELVFDIGGGIKNGGTFKAVQMGGPSGGCIPAPLKDTPVDFESIPKTGAIMGSGGMVVLDDHSCMVEMARFFLDFTQKESCGKCTFCRIGTLRMLEILQRIVDGKGTPEDIEKLEQLARHVGDSSLCGLGQTAPNPVLTTLRYYRDEYEAHVNEHRCPAHVCQALVQFSILPDRCVGCDLCAKSCPVQAISGERKQPHSIDPQKCIKCGKCQTLCNFSAIERI